MTVYRFFGKRLFDIIFSSALICALAPLLIGLAILVRSRLGPPIFFFQVRPGRGEKPFTLFKFRSMSDPIAPDGRKLLDAERLTPLGSWLRRTSLDELPELFNIFLGHMSFVGPRPLLMEYLPFYTARERLRHSVRPGLTGLAQVEGRNFLKWNDRFELDIQYVERYTAAFDLWILIRTFFQVIRSKNIAVPGTVQQGFVESRSKDAGGKQVNAP